MRVSEYYNLGKTQPELDFVDVDIYGDVKVFVDPRALRQLDTDWGAECRYLIQNFFSTVLSAIQIGDHEYAVDLLSSLGEPNETHLGLSRYQAQGRGVGRGLAQAVWNSLSQSRAVASGLIQDLEDTVLLIEGISNDIVSDMTTNIIRAPLIRYTQSMSEIYGIPLETVDSGPIWDPDHKNWENGFERLPVADHSKLLLVPKSIVRSKLEYDLNEYYRTYLLGYLQRQELAANSELVRLLKDGRRVVFKKDVEKKYGRGKAVIAKLTQDAPEVLDAYRQVKDGRPQPPLSHIALAEISGTDLPDWDALLDAVLTIPPGRDGATDYERAIQSLIGTLFSPWLSYPQRQTPIHQGRKRVDITYMNAATEGFFDWLRRNNFFCPFIFFECKNYADTPNNPELDQLTGRFSVQRDQVGVLICRKIADKERFIERCRDAVHDNRGYVIPLDDQDLIELVREAKSHDGLSLMPDVLVEKFTKLVM